MLNILVAIITFIVPVTIIHRVFSPSLNALNDFNILELVREYLIITITILYAGTAWFMFNSEAFGYSVDVVKITLDSAALMH